MFQGSVGEVGCFGKLPLSPEFIRVNAKGSTLQDFDQWMQEGLLWCRAKLGPQWRNNFLKSESWNFLFQVPKQKEWLIGVMMPSQDKAGRGFPMTLFLRIENFSGDQALIPMLPLLLQDFLEKAKHLLQEEWKTLSLIEFREKVGKLIQPDSLKQEQVHQLYHEFLRSYSLKTFLRMCGVATQRLADSELKGVVKKMLTENRHPINSLGGQLMSFPLIDEPAFPFEIPFWMEYLNSINGKHMAAPLLFWNKCPSKGRAVLLTQDAPVATKSFWSLLHSDQSLETVWEMRSTEQAERLQDEESLMVEEQFPEKEKDETLNDLLQK